jgi:hypothetical protein
LPDKVKIIEEQKQIELKKQQTLKAAGGRSKLLTNAVIEPKVQ